MKEKEIETLINLSNKLIEHGFVYEIDPKLIELADELVEGVEVDEL